MSLLHKTQKRTAIDAGLSTNEEIPGAKRHRSTHTLQSRSDTILFPKTGYPDSCTQRFLLNLGIHFENKFPLKTGRKAVGSGEQGSSYAELEQHTALLMPSIKPGMKILAQSSTNTSASISGDNGAENAIAMQGLADVEIQLCRAVGLRYDRYRCAKARILFAQACVFEQNLRVCSGRLCRSHPFLADTDEKYRCINFGKSQVQNMCRGLDVNMASQICKHFMQWGWIPPNHSSYVNETTAVGLVDHVEKRFPVVVRRRLLDLVSSWDESEHLPMPYDNKLVVKVEQLNTNRTIPCTNTPGCRYKAVKDKVPHFLNAWNLPLKQCSVGKKSSLRSEQEAASVKTSFLPNAKATATKIKPPSDRQGPPAKQSPPSGVSSGLPSRAQSFRSAQAKQQNTPPSTLPSSKKETLPSKSTEESDCVTIDDPEEVITAKKAIEATNDSTVLWAAGVLTDLKHAGEHWDRRPPSKSVSDPNSNIFHKQSVPPKRGHSWPP